MPTYPKKIALEGFGLLAKAKIGECIKLLSVILVKPLLPLDGDLLTKGQLQTLNYLWYLHFIFLFISTGLGVRKRSGGSPQNKQSFLQSLWG